MPDLLQESRLSLTQLAHQEGVSIPTTWRWAKRGVKGIRLESFCVGGRRYTTQEAFARFVERTTAVANGDQPKVRTNRHRQAAIDRADDELTSQGI